MKELYSFNIERIIEKEIPEIKKTKNGPVETNKKIQEKKTHRVILQKPSSEDIENAEFFYGQKYNEFINAGFLTKAMLVKKMGDIGGMSSKMVSEQLQKSIIENLEASRVIEFYGGVENLSEEQEQKLLEAREKFIKTKNEIFEYEQSMRSQFNQTADAKAEQKLIEWFVFHFSHYEDEAGDKKEIFPLFDGNNYNEKRSFYLEISEDIEDIETPSLLKTKQIYDKSFATLIRAVSIWYNKMGNNQESISAAIKDLFE